MGALNNMGPDLWVFLELGGGWFLDRLFLFVYCMLILFQNNIVLFHILILSSLKKQA